MKLRTCPFITFLSEYLSLYLALSVCQQPTTTSPTSAVYTPTSLFGLDQKVSRTLLLQRFAFSFHPSLILSLSLSLSTFFVFLFSPAVLHSCFPGRKKGGESKREREKKSAELYEKCLLHRVMCEKRRPREREREESRERERERGTA